MATRREHRVEFLSPGTLFSESSTKIVDSWDIVQACRMSSETVERHGARPYGFRFQTFIVSDDLDDGEGGTLKVNPKKVSESGVHYLGGDVLSFDDIPDTEEFRICRSNMRGNDYAFVCRNTNSYTSTMPFDVQDVLVDPESGDVLKCGEDPDLMDYRVEFKRRCREYYDSRKEPRP